MLYPLQNSQFLMNTVGPYGPSRGERVKLTMDEQFKRDRDKREKFKHQSIKSVNIFWDTRYFPKARVKYFLNHFLCLFFNLF